VREILEGSTRGLADAEAFVYELGRPEHPEPEARGLFDPGRELTVARAPGRLDLMGGIADYSGALVLQWPLRQATLVAAQRHTERVLRIVSLGAEAGRRSTSFETSLAALEGPSGPLDYPAARALFAGDPSRHWAAYVAGTLLVLMRERGVRFEQGVRLLIRSDVPEGKGVSSSAALEVAAMQAVASAFGIAVEPRELAILCQKVENLVVGAPCGVMDQMTAACGRAQELLALLCQPAELQGSLAVPAEIGIWGLDSGVRHAVSGSDYASVRVGAFMGARIMADLVGGERRWSGYLASVAPSAFERDFAPRLPQAMEGAEFLARYGATTDSVTRVEPSRIYAVRTPTAHPVYEHFRVRTFRELLAPPVSEARLELMGELMLGSHESYSACGLGSEATDRIVSVVRERGDALGFYGAKITGGGSGGTVAVLGRSDADIEQLARACAAAAGAPPRVFSGSSPGAAAFGRLRLGPLVA
jgi:galactokinase